MSVCPKLSSSLQKKCKARHQVFSHGTIASDPTRHQSPESTLPGAGGGRPRSGPLFTQLEQRDCGEVWPERASISSATPTNSGFAKGPFGCCLASVSGCC